MHEIGEIIEVTVSGIENYGIFVSLDDGYTGLIHISEIDNTYVKDVNEYAKIGEITIDYKTIGDDIKLNSYDLVYIGCGSNENLLIALDDIQRLGKQFKKYIDDGKYVISTGNSYLLFGDKIDDSKALGIFDYYAASEKRIQGEVLYKYFGLDKNIIGFQNRQYIVNNKKNHLFKVLSGPADNFKTEFEGYHENNFFGTFTVGPLLIRNPHFANMIINDILKKHGLKFHNDDNTILSKAYDAYIKNFYE